ncbi:phage portal protein [Natronoglomus mannanivorans]|uniref:Phage portal protein n=1 Tax=Natronoglomus mannanivorans TaxID=2979990 RepID=A0AAP2Z3Q7_9EURY|nr:phage portal protein [Halobacteria archaeon AArc-xg1-1]
MPVYSPTASTHALTPSTDTDARAGQIPRQMTLEPSKGIPRYEDLIGLRVIERSPTVSLPMNTVKDQVTTTDWHVQPTVDNPTSAHNEAADEITEFLDGNFNANNEEFDHLIKKVVNDILSPDTGVIEKVPTAGDGDERWLAELYHLDGITMTKQLDKHGVMPEPPSPAYWQFSPRSAMKHHSWDDVIDKLGSPDVAMNYGRNQHDPIPFSRDQITWIETNPRPETQYGYGIVQQARRWAEILLNVDVSNRTYFADNEIPKGILTIAAGSQQELDRSRAYFQDTIKGETDHIIPMFDAPPDAVDYKPIQGTPEELQFLDSQQWYHKLVWFLFGLNQGEIGDSAEVNRSTAEEHSRQVFRQTTRPMLDVIEKPFNVQILPAMEAYWRVDGELEFVFEVEHEQMQELERRRQSEDLANNVTTPNAIRRDRGEEELPWGDVPKDVITSMARKHPEWALEHWGGVDGEDLPDPGVGGDLFGSSSRSPRTSTSTDSETETQERGTGNSTPALEAHDEGEIGDEFPGVADLIGNLEGEVARQIETELEDLEDVVEERWPEDPDDDRSVMVDVDGMVQDIQLQDVLLDPVVEANSVAMQESADQEADRLEEELEDRFGLVPEVAEVSIDFDLSDTFAWEAMRRRATTNMVSVEETVRNQIRNVLLDVATDGGGVGDVTAALRERVEEISDNHSRLIARTELPQASREGTQALGEATDVVGGKRWNATNDSQSRPWHAAMDDVVVGIDDSWTVPAGWEGAPDYQPSDYPRVAHVVGEDHPFNCRCVQQNVLEEDLPDDVQSLTDFRGVSVDLQVTSRQFEVWQEHARDGEDMATLLHRIANENSARQGHKLLSVSSATYYDWLGSFGIRS